MSSLPHRFAVQLKSVYWVSRGSHPYTCNCHQYIYFNWPKTLYTNEICNNLQRCIVKRYLSTIRKYLFHYAGRFSYYHAFYGIFCLYTYFLAYPNVCATYIYIGCQHEKNAFTVVGLCLIKVDRCGARTISNDFTCCFLSCRKLFCRVWSMMDFSKSEQISVDEFYNSLQQFAKA